MVAAPYEMFNMGNKTHPQQPDTGNIIIIKLNTFEWNIQEKFMAKENCFKCIFISN